MKGEMISEDFSIVVLFAVVWWELFSILIDFNSFSLMSNVERYWNSGTVRQLYCTWYCEHSTASLSAWGPCILHWWNEKVQLSGSDTTGFYRCSLWSIEHLSRTVRGNAGQGWKTNAKCTWWMSLTSAQSCESLRNSLSLIMWMLLERQF